MQLYKMRQMGKIPSLCQVELLAKYIRVDNVVTKMHEVFEPQGIAVTERDIRSKDNYEEF